MNSMRNRLVILALAITVILGLLACSTTGGIYRPERAHGDADQDTQTDLYHHADTNGYTHSHRYADSHRHLYTHTRSYQYAHRSHGYADGGPDRDARAHGHVRAADCHPPACGRTHPRPAHRDQAPAAHQHAGAPVCLEG
jgi:hypothetical protein